MCHYWLLVIDLVMLIDSYRSMITRGFLSPLLCLSLDILFAAKENLWDQGTYAATFNQSTSEMMCNVGGTFIPEFRVEGLFNA